MIYYKEGAKSLAESTNFDEFYLQVLQIVKDNWDRKGNRLIGISDDKMYRLFSGKGKDADTIFKMAEFMQISLKFIAF